MIRSQRSPKHHPNTTYDKYTTAAAHQNTPKPGEPKKKAAATASDRAWSIFCSNSLRQKIIPPLGPRSVLCLGRRTDPTLPKLSGRCHFSGLVKGMATRLKCSLSNPLHVRENPRFPPMQKKTQHEQSQKQDPKNHAESSEGGTNTSPSVVTF